ncbi:MAG: FlgD immunoglobulin-like domain containing protein, partial [Candidatus Eisenbacteria bacterium]
LASVTTRDSAFGGADAPIMIPPAGSALLTVRFLPTQAGSAAARLTLASDDPDTPVLDVSLTGEGVVSPDVELSTSSLLASLSTAESTTRTIEITNRGGSDLSFTIAPPATATTPVGIEGNGGPDLHGTTWRDSDDADGPTFAWIDLGGTGTLLPLTSDDATVTGVPLGFEFPFYGSRFATVNVSSNGWISFTSTATTGANQPIPNSGPGVPEHLLAAFWDDLATESGSRIVARADSARFVVSWEGVPRFGSGGPYTFQIVLTPDGRIRYQYRSMAGLRLDEATIGIQDGSRSDGMLVAHNAAYARDSLAVEFSATPAWISVSPVNGLVAPGESQPITVTLRRGTLPEGEHDGVLRIATNDPDEPVLFLPIRFSTLPTPEAAIPTGVGENGPTAPRVLSFRIAGENPAASGAMTLRLSLPTATRVALRLYDVRGALVRRLTEGNVAAGWHLYHWDGRDERGLRVGSGIYFARLYTERRSLTARIVVVR